MAALRAFVRVFVCGFFHSRTGKTRTHARTHLQKPTRRGTRAQTHTNTQTRTHFEFNLTGCIYKLIKNICGHFPHCTTHTTTTTTTSGGGGGVIHISPRLLLAECSIKLTRRFKGVCTKRCCCACCYAVQIRKAPLKRSLSLCLTKLIRQRVVDRLIAAHDSVSPRSRRRSLRSFAH